MMPVRRRWHYVHARRARRLLLRDGDNSVSAARSLHQRAIACAPFCDRWLISGLRFALNAKRLLPET